VLDPDAETFLAPGNMPARIVAAVQVSGQAPPNSRPAIVRCILDSLALAFARTMHEAQRLAGRTVKVVHLVGGGSRNALLCQLTANACELPVEAGPAESTALGNIVVQARAHGLIGGSLEDARQLIRLTHQPTRYQPAAAVVRSG
jgi:rhamnulokinase